MALTKEELLAAVKEDVLSALFCQVATTRSGTYHASLTRRVGRNRVDTVREWFRRKPFRGRGRGVRLGAGGVKHGHRVKRYWCSRQRYRPDRIRCGRDQGKDGFPDLYRSRAG